MSCARGLGAAHTARRRAGRGLCERPASTSPWLLPQGGEPGVGVKTPEVVTVTVRGSKGDVAGVAGAPARAPAPFPQCLMLGPLAKGAPGSSHPGTVGGVDTPPRSLPAGGGTAWRAPRRLQGSPAGRPGGLCWSLRKPALVREGSTFSIIQYGMVGHFHFCFPLSCLKVGL